MKKIVVFFIVSTILAGCNFKNDDDNGLMKIPGNLKSKAEKKFGHDFNEEREKLGFRKIPYEWHATYNENYQIYFSKNENIDHVKGYVCKIVTYDKDLNIISEEDYFRSTKNIPVNEDCDDDHFSFIYDFIEKEYRFDSNCCSNCAALEVPWDNTKDGYVKKRDELLSKM